MIFGYMGLLFIKKDARLSWKKWNRSELSDPKTVRSGKNQTKIEIARLRCVFTE